MMMTTPHPGAKTRQDGEGFISQVCARCDEMKFEERFWTEPDGKGGWQLQALCIACDIELNDGWLRV